MKLAIITHVPHGKHGDSYFAYGPYVTEMNIWGKYAEMLLICAPLEVSQQTNIESVYEHRNIQFHTVEAFHFKTGTALFSALWHLPAAIWTIFKVMRAADHIHLRCPGNMGLLGCLVQVFFPHKPKTAKYAGNWDPESRQPISYRLQKWMLNNAFLTRNMQTLVYGEWPSSSKNIKPFFTATYGEKDKQPILPRRLEGRIQLLFVGTLSEGKQPLYAIELASGLSAAGFDVGLDLYGEGQQRGIIEKHIEQNNLHAFVSLKGNQTKNTIQKAYADSHFILLPSRSEGWPKVVAEAMFWGCFPVATKVSCVPYMLGDGDRGILLDMQAEADVHQLIAVLKEERDYDNKVRRAMEWSRQFTLDLFENEIKVLLKK
jgi:glycosyltransferase involved in cell wall biosynthesis